MVIQCLFWINAFIIFWGMIGYNLSLKFLGSFFGKRRIEKNYEYKPKVSVLIVAHNEENIIYEKLVNVINCDYPKNKIEYIVASDWSTDKTNEIVEKFIEENPDIDLRLYCSKEHKGKTNAQNEAQKFANGEILVMTDANAMFEQNAISELVAAFTDKNIAYVTGKLKYLKSESDTMQAENSYWEGDLNQREIESNIKTITAGNGAIYACRNALYYDFKPINCHDSAMPLYYGELGYRCLYNPDAVAYEKSGQTNEDEFKRKVRMNRNILDSIPNGLRVFVTFFKHGWFSYFYFGHRTCRYLLWLAHIIVLFTSFVLLFEKKVFFLFFLFQVLFFVIAFFGTIIPRKTKVINMVSYYSMTILAQIVGAYNQISGKSKSTWDKAESTR